MAGCDDVSAKGGQQLGGEAGPVNHDANLGTDELVVGGETSSDQTDVADDCVISDITSDAVLDTDQADDELETAARELSLAACAEGVATESDDDESTKELQSAAEALAESPSAGQQSAIQLNPSGEQASAAQQPAEPGPQPYQPPVMGQAGWEKAPDRPPQKLPIRFKDCVGRNIMIPWKVAKSWQGVKNIINSAFAHVDVLGPHVLKGHYDLTAHNVWTSADSAAVNPALASFQHVAPPIAGSSSSSLPAPDPPVPAPLPPSETGPMSPHSSIILPELWEDIVEPGMMITMSMWPMHILNPPAPTPPPVAPVPIPIMPGAPPPPGWMPRRPVRRRPSPPPRRKTRKRQG